MSIDFIFRSWSSLYWKTDNFGCSQLADSRKNTGRSRAARPLSAKHYHVSWSHILLWSKSIWTLFFLNYWKTVNQIYFAKLIHMSFIFDKKIMAFKPFENDSCLCQWRFLCAAIFIEKEFVWNFTLRMKFGSQTHSKCYNYHKLFACVC